MTTEGSLVALIAPTDTGSGTPTGTAGTTAKFGHVFQAAQGGKGQPTLMRKGNGAKKPHGPPGPADSGAKTATTALVSMPVMTVGASPHPTVPSLFRVGGGPKTQVKPTTLSAQAIREAASAQASRGSVGEGIPLSGGIKTSLLRGRSSGGNPNPDPVPNGVAATETALTSRVTGSGSDKPALRSPGLGTMPERTGAGPSPKADPSGHQAAPPLLSGAVVPKPGPHLAPGVRATPGGSTGTATPLIEAASATRMGPTWRVQTLAQSEHQVRLQVNPPASAPLKVEVTLAPQSNATRVALTVPNLAWQHPLVQDSHLLQVRLESQNLPNPEVTVSLAMGNGSGSGQGSAGTGTRSSPLWVEAGRQQALARTVPASLAALDFRA